MGFYERLSIDIFTIIYQFVINSRNSAITNIYFIILWLKFVCCGFVLKTISVHWKRVFWIILGILLEFERDYVKLCSKFINKIFMDFTSVVEYIKSFYNFVRDLYKIFKSIIISLS